MRNAFMVCTFYTLALSLIKKIGFLLIQLHSKGPGKHIIRDFYLRNRKIRGSQLKPNR